MNFSNQEEKKPIAAQNFIIHDDIKEKFFQKGYKELKSKNQKQAVINEIANFQYMTEEEKRRKIRDIKKQSLALTSDGQERSKTQRAFNPLSNQQL